MGGPWQWSCPARSSRGCSGDDGAAGPTRVPGRAHHDRQDRARARHHCVDLVDPDATFDAARFRAAAVAAITDATARGRPVLVVGGTGLWLRALLHGLCPAPA